jgi:hypothetical protein
MGSPLLVAPGETQAAHMPAVSAAISLLNCRIRRVTPQVPPLRSP